MQRTRSDCNSIFSTPAANATSTMHLRPLWKSQPGHYSLKALIASQGTCFGQNVGVDIGRDNRIGATQPIGESARDRTRTTSNLQHPLPERDRRSVQHLSDEFAVTGSRAFLQKGNYT